MTVEEAAPALLEHSERTGEHDEYAQKLAAKVKLQADELREQAEQIEELARYRLLCEEKLRDLDHAIVLPLEIPSEVLALEYGGSDSRKRLSAPYKRHCNQCLAHEAAVNSLESRAVDVEAKWSNAHKTNLELRTVLDKREKELALAHLKISKMMENMKAFEAAKLSAEEHIQQLEKTLISIDKGQTVAGGRVGTKLRQTLDKRARANNALTAITTAQEREIEGLQRGVLELRHALNTEAKRLGFGGVDAVLEVARLREAAAEGTAKQEGLREQLTETRRLLKEGELREAALLKQQTEWEVAKPELGRLKSTAERLEGDNTALLDYIQELTDARADKEKEAAEAKMEIERLAGAKAAIEAAQSAVVSKDTQLEQVYEQLKELRAEVVRVRGERLEDIGKLDSQAQEAQDRLMQQLEAVKAEKASFEAQLQDHQARAGALDQQQWERLAEAREELEKETERIRTAMREDFERRASEAREEARMAAEAAGAERDTALQDVKELQQRLEEAHTKAAEMRTEAEAVMERKSLVEMRLSMLEEEKHGHAAATANHLEQAERLQQAEADAIVLRHQLQAVQAESKRSLESMEADLKAWMSKAKHAQDRYAEHEATARMAEDDSKRRVAAAEAQVKSLHEMVTAQAEEVSDYRRRMMLHVSSTHSSSDPLNGREQALQGMVDELQQKLQRTESQLAKWMSAQDVTEQLEDAKAAQARQEEEFNRLNGEKAALQRRVDEAERDAKAVAEALRNAGVEAPVLREVEGSGTYRDPAGPVVALIDRFNKLQAFVSAESSKAEALEEELASLKMASSTGAREAEMREQQLQSVLGQVTGAMRSAGLQAEEGHLVVELCASLADLSVKQGEASAAMMRIQGLEADLEDARQAAAGAKDAGSSEVAEARRRLQELEREKEADRSSARSKERELQGRLGAAEERADSFEAQIARLEGDLSRAENRLYEIGRELESARDAAADAERRTEARDAEARRFSDTVEERDVELNRLRRLLRTSSIAGGDSSRTPATDASAYGTHGAGSHQGAATHRYREMATTGLRAGSRIPPPGSRLPPPPSTSGTAPRYDAAGDLSDQHPLRRRLLGTYQNREESSDDDDNEDYDDAASAVSAPPRLSGSGGRVRQGLDSGAGNRSYSQRGTGGDGGLRESLSATERLRRARAQAGSAAYI